MTKDNPNSQTKVQAIAEICNDLRGLTPVGTISFYNLPTEVTAILGVPVAPRSRWNWLDLNFLMYNLKIKQLGELVNPIILQLRFLTTYKYIVGTYTLLEIDSVVICKVRLYSVSSDIPGSRHLNEWRLNRRSAIQLEKNLKQAWSFLIGFIDYSAAGWSGHLSSLIDFWFDSIPESHLHRHLTRWTLNSPAEMGEEEVEVSLFTKLQRVYNSVKSPSLEHYPKSAKSSTSLPTPPEVISRLVNASKTGTAAIPGIKSNLYSFQVRSVCKMFERETKNSYALSPNMLRLKCPNSNRYYYFDLATYTFFDKPSTFRLPRGGILAENMGLGKTLICLSLICLTKNDYSRIPHDQLLIFDETSVQSSVSSLVDICRNSIAQNSLPWSYYKDDLPESVIRTLLDNPGSFKIPLVDNYYESAYSLRMRQPSKRRRHEITYKTLFLCNTTLIVVPDNLFHQWSTEIRKHVEPGYLKVLYISSHFKGQVSKDGTVYSSELPTAKELLSFDAIILTNSFLSKQESESALHQVYWKRLIIDEGHSASSKSKTSILCKQIQSERRWAVTGTPTSGLTKLHMDEETEVENSPKRKLKYTVRDNFREREDLVKLGNLVGNFLQIEPFHSQPKYWGNQVIKPFMGRIFGSELTIAHLLDSIMIRHRSEDIESDLQLPHLHHEAVFLEPSYHNRLSINLFTAVLAVNAVSSERKDIDYMFHPANVSQLRRLVTNLQRATFHWTGFKQEDVETLIQICTDSLVKKRSDGSLVYSSADRDLLKKSAEIAQLALSNARWRTSALLHEMNYYVYQLPDIFVSAFSTGVLSSQVSVFGAPHLHQVQEFFYKNRFAKTDVNLQERIDFLAKPFWNRYWKENVKRNAEKFNKQDTTQEIKKGQVVNAINGSKSQRMDEIEEIEIIHKTGLGTQKTEAKEDWNYENIKKTKILGTASTKLSYLSSRLLDHQKHMVKSLVFFDFEDSAYYLTELLDVLGVNYILYATFISPAMRAKNLSDFTSFDSETSGGITLIMDLRLASHGLTIIAATHVYFVSPVWQRSVEAQAIKRAHRIGQTKDVYVETLVLKGTLEEEIYKRRSKDEQKEETPSAGPSDAPVTTGNETRKYVIDDTGMREYILQHKFLPSESGKEYCQFEAPPSHEELSTVIQASENPDSLLKHSCETTGNLTKWSVYLFNNDNLAKLRQKRQQPEFVKQFLETEVETPQRISKPARKKVRF